MNSGISVDQRRQDIKQSHPNSVVHLELHTGDLRRASAFYSRLLCWRSERIYAGSGSYHALELGAGFGGGIVECGTRHALLLPYVEFQDNIGDRCDDPPVVTELSEVGSFRLFGD
jgi:hypothetical protein